MYTSRARKSKLLGHLPTQSSVVDIFSILPIRLCCCGESSGSQLIGWGWQACERKRDSPSNRTGVIGYFNRWDRTRR